MRRSDVWLTTGNIPIMSLGGTKPAPDVLSPSGMIGIFPVVDRKSTRLNSSHVRISYAVFCLKKKAPVIASFNATNFSITSGAVNTIQDIALTASPTFACLNLTTALTVAIYSQRGYMLACDEY